MLCSFHNYKNTPPEIQKKMRNKFNSVSKLKTDVRFFTKERPALSEMLFFTHYLLETNRHSWCVTPYNWSTITELTNSHRKICYWSWFYNSGASVLQFFVHKLPFLWNFMEKPNSFNQFFPPQGQTPPPKNLNKNKQTNKQSKPNQTKLKPGRKAALICFVIAEIHFRILKRTWSLGNSWPDSVSQNLQNKFVLLVIEFIAWMSRSILVENTSKSLTSYGSYHE